MCGESRQAGGVVDTRQDAVAPPPKQGPARQSSKIFTYLTPMTCLPFCNIARKTIYVTKLSEKKLLNNIIRSVHYAKVVMERWK